MATFWIVVLVIVLLASGVLTMIGFTPAKPLTQFSPDRSTAPRRFVQSPDQVLAAYRDAVPRTPGMRLADQGPRMLYIDSRPTSRILGGDFGVVLRVSFDENLGGGTLLRVEAQAKVFGPTRVATLRELERALRMRAKAVGISELVH